MKPLFTLLSLIIFITPAWADLHRSDLPTTTPSYDVGVILAERDLDCISLETEDEESIKVTTCEKE